MKRGGNRRVAANSSVWEEGGGSGLSPQGLASLQAGEEEGRPCSAPGAQVPCFIEAVLTGPTAV